MNIETKIKTIEATGADIDTEFGSMRLPLSLLPAGAEVGQSLWLSFSLTPPTPTSPQAILNELLHPDDPQRIA